MSVGSDGINLSQLTPRKENCTQNEQRLNSPYDKFCLSHTCLKLIEHLKLRWWNVRYLGQEGMCGACYQVYIYADM